MRAKTLLFACLCGGLLAASAPQAHAELKAGAAIVDVTPKAFPVLVNGGMTSRSATGVTTTVNARAIVLDDGNERLGIVVVDSCMMSREVLDEAKQLASQRTKIRPERMLISATHTHTAPASMGCLGTSADPTYIPYLREKLAEALAKAEANLAPARVGFAVANAHEYTALRRWIRRTDRVDEDPFGNPTVRANMHAAGNPDNVTGESGPEDPDLSVISIQTPDGRPIALLANFSMHYFSGQAPVSADYFGLFCERLEAELGRPATDDHPAPFVALMSHGCSGDIWRRDYTKPAPPRDQGIKIEAYAAQLAQLALSAHKSIQHRDGDLAMAETRLHLNYRVPDKQRLQWAQQIVAEMGDRLPKTRTEVYAREQILLDEKQSTDVVIQALRIGDIAITTTPNETYALTGLKLKLASPLRQTMVIELANGGDGYIPPPEQHFLGGYNTWAARSAGLEVEAEPKITQAALELLEQVCGKPRRAYQQSRGPAVAVVLEAGPAAYWRLDEWQAPRAIDSSGNHRDGIYEPGCAFFLEGPESERFCTEGEVNRAAHFAGGRLAARIALEDQYSISLWFWNGMPVEGRDVTGWMFSRGHDHGRIPQGDHLGLGGNSTQPGRLIFQHGHETTGAKPAIGKTALERWTWNHLVLVRDGGKVRVYLNGNLEPEIETTIAADVPPGLEQIFIGGRCDRSNNFEGRLDEVAVFDRPLSAKEIAALAGR